IPSTTRLTGNIQIAGSSKKVTLSLRDADVKQVLRMFADKANMNIIFHNTVRGEVTLDLKDVPINTALEFVLDACELTYIRQDNNIIIASKDAAKDLSYARQNFTTIPVKYVNAQSVADFVNKSMFNGKYQGISSVPVVAVNANKNELMVFGTEEDELLIKKILTKLDVKPMMNVFPVNHISPQEMAATICDTILSDKSEGGANQGVSISTPSRGSGGDEIELGGGYTVCVVGENNGSIEESEETEDLVNYTSNPLTVAYFPALGTVATYGGSREQVKMIESFIKLHDKKQPMAYIELSLIQLSENGSKAFSSDWMVWTPLGGFNFNATSGFSTNQWAPTFFKGNSYNVVDDQGEVEYSVYKHKGWGPIVMSLNYLINNGKGRVLASPKVMVTNGKKSTIDLTTDYVKSVKREFSTETQSLQAITNVTYEIGSDMGIQVEITPFISPEGYVVMNLKPNYSTRAGGTDDYTLLSRRSLELENVRVKDGETLVLAGLIQENETNEVTKMPILGDLPVIGTFFRSTSNIMTKEELVILITPHIVYSQDQIENLKKNGTPHL
ncbi:TPA: hypothetical protein IAA92_01520, partial [Candidatus Galligastranaerophilus intestinigallinarum]|nr:hypothetical protein [Candidatus Galligastranaerophilus intestinigallinarum]